MKLQPLLLSALLLLTACGGGGGEDSTVLPANAAGVLLQGDDDDPALESLRDMPPTAAPADTIVSGLLTTRLEAFVHPDATVEEVNDALRGAGAAIVSMSASFPALTLVVPAMADVDEAAAIAAQLEASDAFWLATPAFEPRPLAPFAMELLAPTAGVEWDHALSLLDEDVSHLDAMRMKAAGNAARAARGGPVPVLVPDYYTESTPSPSVSAQRVRNGPGLVTDPIIGNRGSIACSIMAIDGDNESFDGVHPTPEEDLALDSLLLGGLTWTERMTLIPQQFPFGDFVLNTGINYTGLGFGPSGYRSKAWRILDALAWRRNAGPSAESFVHFASAGDTGALCGDPGESYWMSPWSLSAWYEDLMEAVDDEGLDTDVFELLLDLTGGQPEPLANLRTVGSSRTDGERSSFSSRNADLRVLGENVHTDCRTVGGPCTPDGATVSTTRAACAQVSGLAGWLWSIDPELSPSALLERLDRAWFQGMTPGILDAYHATLALDTPAALPVRSALLDVADDADFFEPEGDGKFDDHDLAVALAGLVQQKRRYDLNGDGLVGGEGRAPFDLTMDPSPEFTLVELAVEGEPHSYDEAALTDLEILCFYAYSDLFTGDAERRHELLSGCHDGVNDEPLALETLEILGDAYAQMNFVGVDDSFDSYDLAESSELATAQLTGVRGSVGVVSSPLIDGDGVFRELSLDGFCQTSIGVEGLSQTEAYGTTSIEVGFSVPRQATWNLLVSFQGAAAPAGPLDERAAMHVELTGTEPLFEREFGVPGASPTALVDTFQSLEPGFYRMRVLVLARSWTPLITEEAIDTEAAVNWTLDMSVVETR